MDEPTTALDVVVQRDILAQIVELKETLGFSILFITHDLSLLLELADRIAVMYAGQLMEIGVGRCRSSTSPRTRTPRACCNSFPSLRGPRRELAGIPGTPPDLRNPPPGCPFLPRCGYGTDACTTIDMSLATVADVGRPRRSDGLPVRAARTHPRCPPTAAGEGRDGHWRRTPRRPRRRDRQRELE